MSLERLPPATAGATGATGAAGPTGPTGRLGPPGLDGEQGEDGLPGLGGPAGAAGAQGPPGGLGPPGLEGEPGEGELGPPGPRGATGATGATGAAGPIGPPGMGGDEDGAELFMLGMALDTDLYEIANVANVRGDLLVTVGPTAAPRWDRLPNPAAAESVLASTGGGPIGDPFWANTGDLVGVTARTNVLKNGLLVGTRRGIDFVEGPNVRLGMTDDLVGEEVQIIVSAVVPMVGMDGEAGDDGFPIPGPMGPTGTAGAAGAVGRAGPPGFDGEDGESAFPILGATGPPGPTGSTGATGATGPAGPIGIGLDGEDSTPELWLIGSQTGGTGTLNGTGVAGQLALWSGATTLIGDADLTFDSVNQFFALGVGDAVPSAGITVFGATQAQATIALTASTAASAGARVQMRASRGTPAVPASLALNDAIFTLQARGWDGATYANVAQMRVLATEAYSSSSNHGSFLDISTTPTGTTAPVIALKLDQNADVLSQVLKAGATRLLGFSNTSNTASAQAQLDTAVGGTTAGDPFHTFTIPSGSSWAIGVDNSDSDRFKICQSTALGTNDVLFLDTALNATFVGSVSIRSVGYTWPASQGAASTVLQNDGSGGLSWSAAGGTGPAGPTGARGPAGFDGEDGDAFQIGGFQPVNGDLTGLASLTGTGLVVRTAAGTYVVRTFTAAGGANMSDGDGVAANPLLTLDTDLAEIAGVANVRGDLLVTDSTPFWRRLALGAAGTVLQSNGLDAVWATLSTTGGGSGTPGMPGEDGESDFPIMHANISGSDVHTQYAYLVGRAGGQIYTGGTASSDSNELLANSAAQASANTGRLRLNERLLLWPSAPATVDSAVSVVSFTPSTTLSPTGISAFRLLDLSPTVTISPAAGAKGSAIRCIIGGGTYTSTAFNGFDSFQFFLASATLSSATAAVPPIGPIWFFNQGVLQATANDVGTVGAYTGFDENGTVKTITNASAKIAVTDYISFQSRPSLTTSIAGQVAAITTRTAFLVSDVTRSGAGSETLGTNVGIDIQALTQDSGAPISLRSAGATVEARHAGPVRIGSSSAGPLGGSILHIDGGLTVKRTTKADLDYTALTSDLVIEYTSLTADRTVTLPAAATADVGKVYVVKKGLTGAFNVIINPNGAELIDGGATLTVSGPFGAARIYSTGTAWMSF